MPSRSGSSSARVRAITSIVALSIAYAALRYNVLGGVPWSDFPLFILNKGIALGSVALIAVSYLANRWMPPAPEAREPRRRLARQAGLTGFALASAHALASFVLFVPAYYPRLFAGGELSTAGQVCLVAGALATALFTLPFVYSVEAFLTTLGRENWKRAQRLGYAALAITAVHVASIGMKNWVTPSAWPGGLLPISLISFLACVVPIGVKFGFRRPVERPVLEQRA